MKAGSFLFLGKKADPLCAEALSFLKRHAAHVEHAEGEFGQPFPDRLRVWEGDVIVSYLSRWIVPAPVLSKARVAAINFHPATPEYPGIGCNNFALYENAPEYGTTCHHMATAVDTGGIIAVKRFSVFDTDDVASLLTRTYQHQIVLFYEIASLLLQGLPLPSSPETWTRKPFTRAQLNNLAIIDSSMSPGEIQRRVRAVTYGPWKPQYSHEKRLHDSGPPAADSDRGG